MKIRKKIIFMILIFVTGIALLAGWLYVADGNSGGAQPNARTVAIEKGNVEEIVTAQGTIEPKNYVDVGAQVSGQLTSLYVEVGDPVKAGDLLAEIDPRVYESRVEADLAELKNLKAQLAQAEAERVLAKQKHERNKRLIKIDAVSKESVEISESEFKVATASVDALKAEIDAAQSTLDEDKTNLEYTKIYAPMTGTVSSITTREGQMVNANMSAPTIVSIADLDQMTVTAEVVEADIMRVKEGMRVNFATLGNLEDKKDGVVRQIQPTPEVENDVVLYNVLIDVDNKDRSLMNGMTAQVFFIIGRAYDAPLIPVEALTRRVRDQDNAKGQAYLVRTESGAGGKDVVIHVGLTDRTHAVITDGLTAGESIIIPETAFMKKESGEQKRNERGGPPPLL